MDRARESLQTCEQTDRWMETIPWYVCLSKGLMWNAKHTALDKYCFIIMCRNVCFIFFIYLTQLQLDFCFLNKNIILNFILFHFWSLSQYLTLFLNKICTYLPCNFYNNTSTQDADENNKLKTLRSHIWTVSNKTKPLISLHINRWNSLYLY